MDSCHIADIQLFTVEWMKFNPQGICSIRNQKRNYMKRIGLLSLALIVFTAFSWNAKAGDIYNVNASSSSIKWTGYHLAKSYEHWGNISIKSGSVEIEEGELVGGEFVIDMNSISNGDIEKEKDNNKLVNHLKSDDFFNAKEYPEASLAIKSVSGNGGKYSVTADITIRGITKEVEFEASRRSTGETVEFLAKISVDRTEHKVLYGWSLENVVISNTFDLEINLVASK